MSKIAAQQRVRIVLLLLSMLVASVWPAPSPIQAQTGPTAAQNNGWSFVDVARVGQNGFTQLDTGRAGPDGVVVSGVHNGRTGLFHMENNIVTEVATDGQVLSGGLGTLGDIGAFSFQYAVLPNGDVIFKARVTDGSLSPAFIYTFRWSNGTISLAQPSQEIDPETLTQAFDHELVQVTTDDRWLATLRTGPFPTTTTDYGLTDGATRPSIFSFTRGAANCIFDTLIHAAANANGVLAYYEEFQTTPQDGNRCANELGTTRTWSVKLAGAATGTIASGSSFEQVNTYTGAELASSTLFLLNNQNQVAAVRELHNSPITFQTRHQLVVFGSGSEQIIQDTDGPASGIFLADFDQQGRVLYSTGLDLSLIHI